MEGGRDIWTIVVTNRWIDLLCLGNRNFVLIEGLCSIFWDTLGFIMNRLQEEDYEPQLGFEFYMSVPM